ncbi:MAG TPA: hypothetical protein VMC41_02185, partial [Candidatus Nanoarchaeia archaeon]|nr:hypothetical protein [Candidatus Nanoarchaeia archaeon]
MKRKSLLKHPYKFAAVGGAFWGLTLFLATILAVLTGYGAGFMNLVGGIYPGYSISYSGSLVILFFGFMDGFIICYLIAFFNGSKK